MPSRCQSESERPVASSDFERAGDAGAVARHQPCRDRGIAALQLGIAARRPHRPRAARAPFGADIGRDRRNGGEPCGQRLEIEAGASDHDRTRALPAAASLIAAPASTHQRPTE